MIVHFFNTALMLQAEVWYLKSSNLTVDGAIDELLNADGTYCHNFKKKVMKFIVDNSKAVLTSSSFPRLTKSMKGVMLELADSREKESSKHKA